MKKPNGAGALWLLTASLAGIFLVIWAADQGTEVIPRQTPKPDVEVSESRQDGLNELAKRDAADRVATGATLTVKYVEPRHFHGPDLQVVVPTAPGAELGSVITLVASVEGREVSELTYHTVPPDRVVFVRQEAP